MAVELANFLAEQLSRLPENHPDRRLLTGLHEVVAAYTSQVAPETIALGVGEEPGLTQARTGADQLPPDTGENDATRDGFSGSSGGGRDETQGDARPAAAAAQEQQRRLTVAGLVAAAPDFRTTPRGRRMGHFPLATHPTAETTTYYEVFAFNKDGKPWADRLRELALTRGQAVEVIGFEHVVSEKRRDGRPKPNHVYVAAPVKRSTRPEKSA